METPQTKGNKPAAGQAARRNPKGTKQAILESALEEFARFGFGGSRIDEIARDTKTSKRMIYYYFGNKRGLHHAVVLDAVKSVRFLTDGKRTDYENPALEFVRRVDEALIWAETNPSKLRLLTTENQYMEGEDELVEGVNAHISTMIIDFFREPFERGQAVGAVRSEAGSPSIIEVYQIALSLALMRIEHHFSMKAVHDHDIFSASSWERQHALVVETLLRLILVDVSETGRYVEQVLANSRPPANLR